MTVEVTKDDMRVINDYFCPNFHWASWFPWLDPMRDQVERWLVEQGIDHQMDPTEVLFTKKEDAVLFELTWR